MSFCAKPFLNNVSRVNYLQFLIFFLSYPMSAYFSDGFSICVCTHSFYVILCLCLWSADYNSQLSATLLITEATRQWNKSSIFYTLFVYLLLNLLHLSTSTTLSSLVNFAQFVASHSDKMGLSNFTSHQWDVIFSLAGAVSSATHFNLLTIGFSKSLMPVVCLAAQYYIRCQNKKGLLCV